MSSMTEQVKKRIYLYSLNNVISKIELVNVAKFYATDFLFDSIEFFKIKFMPGHKEHE